MSKINDEEIKRINNLYKELGTYTAVAKVSGHSPATIKKYVSNDFKIEEPKNDKEYSFNKDNFKKSSFNWCIRTDFGKFCVLTKEEIEELKDV